MQAFIDSLNLPTLINTEEGFQRLLLTYDIFVLSSIINTIFSSDEYNNKIIDRLYIDNKTYIIFDLDLYCNVNISFDYKKCSPKINIIEDKDTFNILRKLMKEIKSIQVNNPLIYDEQTKEYKNVRYISSAFPKKIFAIKYLRDKIYTDQLNQ